MTKDRVIRLRRKIEGSRERLLESMPFFSLLLMHLKFVALPKMKRISTNGRCIFFSADFLDRLHGYELDYLLCHEVLHIISEDIWREPALAHGNYHFACDLKINEFLLAQPQFRRTMPHLGDLPDRIPGIKNLPSTMSHAQLCASLIFNLDSLDERAKSRFLADSDLYWGDLDTGAEAGELILDTVEQEYIDILPPMSRDRKDRKSNKESEEKKKWRAHVLADGQTVKKGRRKQSHGIGTLPESVKRIIEQTHSSRLDWKKVLQDFLQEQIADYSFTPPDHRYGDSDFFLPGFHEKEYIVKDILFMVDTSESVNDGNLADVYSEIIAALEQFSGKLCGKIGFFDWNVKSVTPIQAVDDLTKITPIGGGGTNFHAIFDYVAANYKETPPACILIFTDGDAFYPKESAAMGVPVLWIIHHKKITPPWGKVLRIT